MRTLGCVLVIAIASACGGDDGGGGGACPCDFGQRCVENVCTLAPQLLVDVNESSGTAAGASAFGCFYAAPTTDARLVSLTEDGPCTITVYQQAPSAVTEVRDLGQLQVEGTLAGTLPLAPTPTPAGCYSTMSTGDLFAEGAQIRFVGTGGSDLPAFSEEIEAPSTIELTAATPVPGQPHALTWTGAPATHLRYHLSNTTAQGITFVSCQLPDTGAFTLPASTTSWLSSDAPFYQSISRYNHVHLEPPGVDAVINLTVTTFDVGP
ncbi:MAG TPA: hypothetical protein VM513_25975 [Kofleriaceae bacterium]|nr:hypothetical protein [Kofleriaceae bacterium]